MQGGSAQGQFHNSNMNQTLLISYDMIFYCLSGNRKITLNQASYLYFHLPTLFYMYYLLYQPNLYDDNVTKLLLIYLTITMALLLPLLFSFIPSAPVFGFPIRHLYLHAIRHTNSGMFAHIL